MWLDFIYSTIPWYTSELVEYLSLGPAPLCRYYKSSSRWSQLAAGLVRGACELDWTMCQQPRKFPRLRKPLRHGLSLQIETWNHHTSSSRPCYPAIAILTNGTTIVAPHRRESLIHKACPCLYLARSGEILLNSFLSKQENSTVLNELANIKC